MSRLSKRRARRRLARWRSQRTWWPLMSPPPEWLHELTDPIWFQMPIRSKWSPAVRWFPTVIP